MSTTNDNSRLTDERRRYLFRIHKAVGGLSAIGEILNQMAALEGSEDGPPDFWSRTLEGGCFDAVEALSREVSVCTERLLRMECES